MHAQSPSVDRGNTFEKKKSTCTILVHSSTYWRLLGISLVSTLIILPVIAARIPFKIRMLCVMELLLLTLDHCGSHCFSLPCA